MVLYMHKTILRVVCLGFLTSSAASAATSARYLGPTRVLHINAEMVRQRTERGIHDRGYKAVGRFIKDSGFQVKHLRVRDLAAKKTRLGKALKDTKVVTISATMTQSVTTVRHILDGLRQAGFPMQSVVIGGRALTAEHAQRWGVGYAASPEHGLVRALALALPLQAAATR